MAITLKEKDQEISKLAEELFEDGSKKSSKKKESENDEPEEEPEEESEKEDSSEKPKEKKKEPKKEKKHRSPQPHGRMIERTVYLGIIFLLLIFFFWNPLYLYFPWNHGTVTTLAENIIENEGYVHPDDVPQPTPEVDETESDASGANVSEDDSSTEDTEEDDASSRSLSVEGVELDIGTIVTEVISSSNSSYGVVHRVEFAIETVSRNQIKPRVKAYVWDEDSPERESETVGNKMYLVMNKGEFESFTLQFHDATFQNYSGTKKLKLELYDIQNEGTDDVDVKLGELVTEFSIE